MAASVTIACVFGGYDGPMSSAPAPDDVAVAKIVDVEEDIALIPHPTGQDADGRMLFLAPDASKALQLVHRHRFQAFGFQDFTFTLAETARPPPPPDGGDFDGDLHRLGGLAAGLFGVRSRAGGTYIKISEGHETELTRSVADATRFSLDESNCLMSDGRHIIFDVAPPGPGKEGRPARLAREDGERHIYEWLVWLPESSGYGKLWLKESIGCEKLGGGGLMLDSYDPDSALAYVWPANGSANQLWELEPLRTEPPRALQRLRDVSGRPVAFSKITEEVGEFATLGAIFFCERARVSPRQRKEQPTLLMPASVWRYISDPATTHAGAFGADHDPLQTLPGWVAVWKFPGDLNRLRGFATIRGVPLPVGEYPFLDDGWWPPSLEYDHAAFRKDEPAEKLRIDPKGIHRLENRAGSQVAMVSSHFFVKELWRVTKEEMAAVADMLADLRAGANLVAFPCWSQHHAIVFYMDAKDGTLVTPAKLARMLRPEAASPVLEILLRHRAYSKESSVRAWAAAYADFYADLA